MRIAALLIVALLGIWLYTSRYAIVDELSDPRVKFADELTELRERYLELVEQQVANWSKEQLEENIKKVEGSLLDQKAAELLRSAEDILGQVNKEYPTTSSGRIAKALLELLEQSRPGRRFGVVHGTVYPHYPSTAAPALPRVPQTNSEESLVPLLEQSVPNQ